MEDIEANKEEIIHEIPRGFIVFLFATLGLIFSLISFLPTLIVFAKLDIIWNFLFLLIGSVPYLTENSKFKPSLFQKSSLILSFLGFVIACGHFFFTKHPWLS